MKRDAHRTVNTNTIGSASLAIQRLMTAEEVAGLLGVSRAWVLAHASGLRRPELPSVKLGKAVRFRPESLEQFIQECTR